MEINTSDINSIENTSPRSSLKTLHAEVPKVKRRKRVTENDYELLKPGQQHFLSERNYRVSQLKEMCKLYGQRVSGNKDELKKRLYNFLRLSYFAIYIQRIIRRILFKRYVS